LHWILTRQTVSNPTRSLTGGGSTIQGKHLQKWVNRACKSTLKRHGITCSMSRRGNCHDNAAVKSFFSLLKRERVYRCHYKTRERARADIFDYIERFCNRQRRHGYLGDLSPVEYDKWTLRTI
jgi:transposase InsO family protein